ncbi:hypothetical protein BGZ60DRAFT_532792 [Tricladium varicosporioides]|nr:hypothetical protein BGZ60DRAFT_532792 [Hymenoscyphus varicosporioides]
MDFFTNQLAASASASASVSKTPVEVATSSLTKISTSRKVRLACDRCHTQKLRCVRNRYQAKCERCIRLKTVCHFGPRESRASLKVRQQDKNQEHGISSSNPIAADSSNSNSTPPRSKYLDADENQGRLYSTAESNRFDWSLSETAHPDLYPTMTGSFDSMQDIDWLNVPSQSRNMGILRHDGFGYFEAPSWCENQSSAGNPFGTTFDPNLGVESHEVSDKSESASTYLVRKLADLNVALFDCAANFPVNVGDSTGTMEDDIRISRNSAILVFDELFRLTADFVEVIRSISGRGSEISTDPIFRHLEQDVANIERMNMVNIPQTSRMLSMNTNTLQDSPVSGGNEGTLLMVVSCHSHLIEMYSTVFEMIQSCIEHSLVPRMGENWVVVLPRLQVGSLATPPIQVDVRNQLPATKSSMYILMILMLSSQLWEQLANLISAGRDVAPVSTSKPHRTFQDTMWDVLTDRTNSLFQAINATRNMLH